jgi:hypothetical protein
VAASKQRLRRNPKSGQSQLLLAAALAADGKLDGAKTAMVEFLKTRPYCTAKIYAQGESYKKGRRSQARARRAAPGGFAGLVLWHCTVSGKPVWAVDGPAALLSPLWHSLIYWQGQTRPLEQTC